MTILQVSPTRLAVYKLLIYGAEDGRPLIAARVAQALGKSEPTISRHIGALKRAGYIRPIKGMESSILYVKGPLGDILDERLRGEANSGYELAQGGGPNAHYCGKQDKTPSKPLPVPTGEAHINGVVVFPVLEQGDLHHPLKVRDHEGERSVTIFDREPTHWGGVTYYKGWVPIDDARVKVQFWDIHEPTLHVWPLPELIVRSTVREAKPRLLEAARRVTSILSKWGGWRFGEPELISHEPGKEGIHYATNDPLIVKHLTPGYQPPADSGYRIDGTPGPVALECDDPDSAEAMLGYLTATRELRRDQDALGLRLAVLDANADKLVSITSKLECAMGNVAAAQSLQIEQAAKDLRSSLNPSEVMYS